MFKRRKIVELEAAFAALEDAHNKLIEDANQLRQRAFIIGIERSGRVNKFTFVRGGQIHVIETMGMLSDDIAGWQRKLLAE